MSTFLSISSKMDNNKTTNKMIASIQPQGQMPKVPWILVYVWFWEWKSFIAWRVLALLIHFCLLIFFSLWVKQRCAHVQRLPTHLAINYKRRRKKRAKNCSQNCVLATNALKSIYQSAYFAANLLLITDGRPYFILYRFHFVLSFLSADANAAHIRAVPTSRSITYSIIRIGCGNIVCAGWFVFFY